MSLEKLKIIRYTIRMRNLFKIHMFKYFYYLIGERNYFILHICFDKEKCI